MSDVSLKVNGRVFTGWETVSITRGIESIAGGFDLAVSDRWSAGIAPWPIQEEDECIVSIAGQVVISGYVDKRHVSFSATAHTLAVTGRDKTGALVDCSAVLSTWEFNGYSLLKLVQKVCEPFDVKVSIDAGLTVPKPSAKLTVDPGDTAFEVIDRACRLAGVLPIADGKGALRLMRPGSARARTALVEGQNIREADAEYDGASRFRKYLVLGQSAGTDTWFGADAAGVRGSAEDPGVRRANRVLVVRPEGNVDTANSKRRAEWEATTRAARSDSVSITVSGWTQDDGSLWPINALVPVRSPHLGIQGDMLITQAVHKLGADGAETSFTLRRPDAFKPDPKVASAGGWKELTKGVE